MMKNLSDDKLLIAEDSNAAFSILYNRYWEPLYKKALVRLGNEADAQDAVAEVFISLWRNRQTIDASNSLANYLFAALKYCIIKKVYRKARQGICVPLSVKILEENFYTDEDHIQFRELQTVIANEINNLPPKMRRIYNLSKVSHLKPAEIAEQLHLSEQTVKNTLTTALKRLRQKIAQYSNMLFSLLL